MEHTGAVLEEVGLDGHLFRCHLAQAALLEGLKGGLELERTSIPALARSSVTANWRVTLVYES
jgi:hypothetical protein